MKAFLSLYNLDKEIILKLQQDARRPFQLIAKELIVSGGTVHVRYNKLKEAGIIEGSRLKVNHEKHSNCRLGNNG